MNKFIGQTVKEIKKTDSEILFICESGDRFIMYHSQDCCEWVSIDDISGDLNDLIGSPILKFEERTSGEPQEGQEVDKYLTFTWTFYTIATVKGYVDIRWYGESNGYYSESVDFEEVKQDRKWYEQQCELLK